MLRTRKEQLRFVLGLGGSLLFFAILGAMLLSRPSSTESTLPTSAAPSQGAGEVDDADPVGLIVKAFGDSESGALVLDPPNKASTDALASDAVPAKAAPDFSIKHMRIRGATRVKVLGTAASVVAYEGEDGHFAVISVKGKPDEFPGLGQVPFGQHRFLNGTRPLDGSDVHLVGVRQDSRMTFLVGRQPNPKLAELATMLPR